jgi:hypothetical protein
MAGGSKPANRKPSKEKRRALPVASSLFTIDASASQTLFSQTYNRDIFFVVSIAQIMF